MATVVTPGRQVPAFDLRRRCLRIKFRWQNKGLSGLGGKRRRSSAAASPPQGLRKDKQTSGLISQQKERPAGRGALVTSHIEGLVCLSTCHIQCLYVGTIQTPHVFGPWFPGAFFQYTCLHCHMERGLDQKAEGEGRIANASSLS